VDLFLSLLRHLLTINQIDKIFFMSRYFLFIIFVLPFSLFAQKSDLPWLLRPTLTGFDTFFYDFGGSNNYIIAKKNKLSALLSIKGEQILDFKYNRISADWAGVVIAVKDGKNEWYDSKGRSFGDDIENIIPTDDGRFAVSKFGYRKWGIVNKNMQLVAPYEYELTDDRANIILRKGEEVINLGKFRTPDGQSSAGIKEFDFNEPWPDVIIYKDKDTSKKGIMSKDGKPISQAVYNLKLGNKLGYSAASLDNKKWGIITSKNKQVVDFIYDDVSFISNKATCVVHINQKVGLIDLKSSKMLIDTGLYDKIKIVNSELDYFVIEKDNLQGICDLKGDVIVQPTYDKALKSGAYFFVVQQLNSDFPQRGLLSLEGKELLKPDSVKLLVFENGTLFMVRPDGSGYHKDINGKLLHQFKPNTTKIFEKTWILEEDGDLTRFYHSTSTAENQIFMDDVSDSEEKLHRIKKDNLYGYMDNSGKLLVAPIFEKAELPDYSSTLKVKFQGKWGVLKNTYN
jgi:WG containing repeat